MCCKYSDVIINQSTAFGAQLDENRRGSSHSASDSQCEAPNFDTLIHNPFVVSPNSIMISAFRARATQM